MSSIHFKEGQEGKWQKGEGLFSPFPLFAHSPFPLPASCRGKLWSLDKRFLCLPQSCCSSLRRLLTATISMISKPPLNKRLRRSTHVTSAPSLQRRMSRWCFLGTSRRSSSKE